MVELLVVMGLICGGEQEQEEVRELVRVQKQKGVCFLILTSLEQFKTSSLPVALISS